MKIHNPAIGSPCWFEFSSTDATRSLAFFCALFDWRHQDQDMGPMGVYSFLLHANGGMVGAHWQMPEAQLAMNIPSNWGVYFKVQSVDASHQQALSVGAIEYVAPMDVSDYGRMSVMGDPGGAVFSYGRNVHPTASRLSCLNRMPLAGLNWPLVTRQWYKAFIVACWIGITLSVKSQ